MRPDANLTSYSEEASWVQPTMIYSKMVQLIDVELYRKPVLHGIVLSIGSRVESTVRIFFSLFPIPFSVPPPLNFTLF
jgi:Tubulin folding cofactor D C terminal